MVTTIDPVVYGGRNRSYVAAIVMHVLGATIAAVAFGAALGGVGGLLGAPWRAAGAGLVVIVSGAYSLREVAGLPIPVPDRRRQVPEWWRTFYSAPIAALLYGLGLGIGFMTFLTFGTFVAVAVTALASGSPVVGALVCGPFGLARGVSILLAGRSGGASTLDRLEALSGTLGPRVVNGAALLLLMGVAVASLGAPDATAAASPAASSLAGTDAKPSQSDGLRAFYPKSPRAEQGVRYPFTLSSCDLGGFVDFDGSFWLPLEDVDEAGLPPRDVLPFHYRGSMTLVNENRSVFRAGGGRLQFDRQDGPTHAYSRSCF